MTNIPKTLGRDIQSGIIITVGSAPFILHVRQLAKYLQQCPACFLLTVMLDGNELGVDGVCTIIEGVQELNWLMILSVTGNVNSEVEEEYVRMKSCFVNNTKLSFTCSFDF